MTHNRANSTVITLTNAEGARATLSTPHEQDRVVQLTIEDADGNIVGMKLSKDNRYRLRESLSLIAQ